MKSAILASLVFLGLSASAAVKIENVKIVITGKDEKPVTVTVPYWVAKAGSEATDMIKIGDKNYDLKKLLTAMEAAPKLGPIMTIEEKNSKVVISIE